MSEQSNRTEDEIKGQLETAIAQWVEDQIAAGQAIPDFWDECGTSEALAEHLVQLGWHK